MPVIPDQLQTLSDVVLGTPVVGQVLTVTAYGSGVATFGLTTPATPVTPTLDAVLGAGNTSTRNLSAGVITGTALNVSGGSTFAGQVNLGGSSGTAYFGADGNLRVPSSSTPFVIYARFGGGDLALVTFYDSNTGVTFNRPVRTGQGFGVDSEITMYSGYIHGYANPLYLSSLNGFSNPIVLGATSTAYSTGVLDVAYPAYFRSSIRPGSVNTATTAGTAAGQVVYDSSGGANSGHYWGWNGSSWKQLDN